MSSTYHSLHYHVVFSTKERERSLPEATLGETHEYLGGIVRGLEGISHGVGGVSDHVHLLLSLTPSHRLADFMRELKKASSTWLRDRASGKGFAWQEGYAAFTVSPSSRPAVHRYIQNQAAHHARRPYLDELKAMLLKAGVTYDPKFLA